MEWREKRRGERGPTTTTTTTVATEYCTWRLGTLSIVLDRYSTHTVYSVLSTYLPTYLGSEHKGT